MVTRIHRVDSNNIISRTESVGIIIILCTITRTMFTISTMQTCFRFSDRNAIFTLNSKTTGRFPKRDGGIILN